VPSDLRKLEKSIKSRLTAAATRQQKQRAKWREPYPLGLRVTALALIENEKWKQLGTMADRYRRDGEKELKAIAGQQQDWGTLWRDIETLRGLLEKQWRPPGQLAEWPAARAQLETRLRQLGLSDADVKAQIDKLAHQTVDELLQPLDSPLDWWSQELAAAATSRLSALAGADVGEAVARFNTLYRTRPGVSDPTPGVLRRQTAELNDLWRGLHAAMRTAAARTLGATARRTERRLARLLDSLVVMAAGLARQRAMSNRAALGPRSIAVADAIQSALSARSAARLLDWIAGWPEKSSLFGEWRTAARSRAFRSSYTAPSMTKLQDVVDDPHRFDGKVVTVAGEVGPVAIRHLGEKVVSSTSLSDPDGTVLRLGLAHIKLDSGGLVMGSYAQVTGTFRQAAEEFDTPTLVIDRRTLSEDSARSWLDWITLQLRPIVTPTPHSLTARWSWVPGVDGPGNLLRYGTWAASRRGRSL
jgi:hypothetical protein